ncbi:MAG: mevalonate kinase [Gammaproteobacteria bacterium]|nr:mevalonate kinase [Gammaproteobacteria bacterium]
MSYDFETTTYGKWILTGEHAVLRGHPALVFPLKNKTLTLQYQASNTDLTLSYQGVDAKACEPSIWKLLHLGFQKLALSPNQPKGKLYIINHIPIGTGLGASAALCVAITRWFKAIFDTDLNPFEFARALEDIFHGQSSGLDIAGSASTSNGIYFQSGNTTPITPTWQPHWCLSFSGKAGITSECIQQVQTLWKNDKPQAHLIDTNMAHSVIQAKIALTTQNNKTELASAIQAASECFDAWGLISKPLRTHMNSLLKAGAIAVKPTGSGGGGHVLSLWDTPPSNLPAIPLVTLYKQ